MVVPICKYTLKQQEILIMEILLNNIENDHQCSIDPHYLKELL